VEVAQASKAAELESVIAAQA
jgi:uncharacterized coiled-coil protein SlyX